jgi:hypothetical protein
VHAPLNPGDKPGVREVLVAEQVASEEVEIVAGSSIAMNGRDKTASDVALSAAYPAPE